MPTGTFIDKHVPDEDLPLVVAGFQREGAVVTKIPETNGFWTVRAVFPDSAVAPESRRVEESSVTPAGRERTPGAGTAATASDNIARLVELGKDKGSIRRIQSIAQRAMQDAGLGSTLHNACAATLSAFLKEAGFDIPMTLGAERLATRLKDRGWKRIDLGEQQPGDVGVTRSITLPPGADHIYLVVRCIDRTSMIIADNQGEPGMNHGRKTSGDGRTPTEYFLRAPGDRMQLASNDSVNDSGKSFFPTDDINTNAIPEPFDDDGTRVLPA